jgi:hypothetical protein
MVNKGRTYTINGIEYPSVTTVLNIIEKPWLAAWEKKEMGAALRTDLLGKDLPKDKLERIDVLDAMIKEAKKFPRTIGAAAMDLGSRIHNAVEELSGGYVIMLNKSGKPDFAVHKVNLEVCFKAFINCLELYKEMKGGNLWMP